MKLSNLVNYQSELSGMTSDTVKQSTDAEIEKIMYLIKSQPTQMPDLAQKLQNQHQKILQAFEEFETELSNLKKQVKQLIETVEKPWFEESYRLYDQEMIHATADYILNRRPIITTETEQFYRARLRQYNNWKYPCMIIRPGQESYIDELLGTDPLYLVDETYELLQPAMNRFNENYQQRLRPYVVNERGDQEILEKIPNNQFGLIFAYNFFNFKPFEVLKKYLSEIYQKLRPGGVLAMTFNDCDRDKGVMLVENHFCCYTPGYLVQELAQSLGYEIAIAWSDQGPATWLELRKPGEFDSLRGGQALAKIIPK